MPNPQLGDTQKVPYVLQELDADNNPTSLQPGDTISILSSDTDGATVAPDPTPAPGSVASGFIVGGKKLVSGLTITATVTHADGSPTLSVVDTIDIVPGAAVNLALSLGTPIPQ